MSIPRGHRFRDPELNQVWDWFEEFEDDVEKEPMDIGMNEEDLREIPKMFRVLFEYIYGQKRDINKLKRDINKLENERNTLRKVVNALGKVANGADQRSRKRRRYNRESSSESE